MSRFGHFLLGAVFYHFGVLYVLGANATWSATKELWPFHGIVLLAAVHFAFGTAVISLGRSSTVSGESWT